MPGSRALPDAFVTRVDPGDTLGYSTYLGGNATDIANAVAIDLAGNAYVTGSTGITAGFPTTSGAYQSSYGGGDHDASVSQLNADGTSLLYSTYLGGSSDDIGNGIAADLDGNFVLTGGTWSSNFPTANALQGTIGGAQDGFITKFNGLPPPVFTSVSDDTGPTGDQVTNDQTLSISGTSVANATITLYRAGVGQLGTTTASGSGLWTYTYATTLAEGAYAFTGTTTSGGKTSLESAPFLVNVDLTAPSVTLNADATTYTLKPVVRVNATDLNLAATTTVTLDVDLNNDGNFTGGDLGYTTGTLTNGVAVIALSPALAIGTGKVRARVKDKAGNEGTSNTQTVVVQTSGTGYTITDLTPQVDPFTGDALLQRGNLTLVHPLDLDLSPGTDVGGSPALVYSSERVSNKPIIAASVQSDNGVALPSTITATLTWDGTPQTGTTFNTTGLSAGDLIVAAQQLSSAVTSTGRHTYSLQVTFNLGSPVSRTINGAVFVVAEDSSSYGAGWTLGSVDKLFSISQQTQGTFTYSAGMLREYGSGGYGFYTDNGAGGYTSPAGDNGTLTKATGGWLTTYTYTRPDGSKQTFDNSGNLVKATSADGFAAITYTYTSGNLTGIATPDGALTTLTLASGKVTTIQTGSRTVTLTIASNDLTGITNPDGGLRTLAYDGSTHRVTDDKFSVLRGTYAYTNGALTGFTTGDSSIASDTSVGRSTVSPASLFGLSSLAAGPVLPSLTDPLGQVTRKQLDTAGRPTLEIAPDGGATQYTRDNNGWVTKITDPLGRVTSLVLDSAGYTTQVTTPDSNSQSYTYQASYHALTQYTDQRGNLYTYTYDANNGHLLTAKDPLSHVTSSTYNSSSGLPETVTDALGRVSTALYDSARRLQTTINALGDRATVTYDGNGNVATRVDELGRTTTFVNDALGRVTQQTDAAGGIWTTTYNGAGLVSSAKDALARLTNYTYNSRSEQTKVVEASGTAQERSQLASFDSAGQQTSSRDANGVWSTQAFDAAGRPKTATDALTGQALSVYDLAGQQTRARDQLGRPTDYVFDGVGRVTKTTDALGNVTSTIYDQAGNVTEVADARGFKVTYAYDALNRQVAMTQAAGTSDAATSTTVYDAVGNVFQTIDPLGHITENTYDALNRLTQVTQAKSTSDQRSMTYAYDKVSNQTSTTDWRGIRTDTSFDNLNRATVVTEAAGTLLARVSTTVYDALGNVTSSVDALGRTASMVYDALNRAVSTTEAVGTGVARTMTTLYDAASNQTGSVDALGHATQTALDVLNRPSVNFDALGNSSRSFYDAAGTPRAGTDANGNRTDYFVDGLGRTERIVDAQGNTSTSIYDVVGNTTGTIDARGNRGTMVYDGLNRVVAQTDALNHTVTSVYDKAGNVVQTIDAQGKTLTYTYDNLNRRITVQNPGTGVATTVYDQAGNVVNTIDPLGHKATMVYDELGRKTKDIDALGGTTSYLYDALNNTTGLIDPVGNRTTFVFDSLNRQTQETDPLNKSMTMAYDAAGRVTSKTDRLGQHIDDVYDNADRLLTETWRNVGGSVVNTLTHVYDNNGNQTLAQDSHGAYTFTYDSLNRASTVKGLFGVTLTFSYDAASNRTKVEDSFGGVLTSVYDAANRLTSRQFGGVSQTPLRFDLAYTERNQVGTLTRYSDLAGSTKVGESDYTYDSVGRLQNLQHINGSGVGLTTFTYAYTYDLASRVTSETLNGGAPTSYSYDSTNQLTNDGTKPYSYDANGNRTMTGYQTGAGNRLTNDGTYTYDDEGNLSKKSKGPSAETWNYTYDNRNQLVGVTERSTDGGGTLLFQGTYVYDVFNNRVEADEYTNLSGTTTVTKSVYAEQGTLFADLTSGNAMQTRYLHQDDARYSPVVARIGGGSGAWLLLDRLGSTRNVVNGSGTLIGTVAYDGFGNIP